MRDPNQHIREILERHGEDFETQTWAVPGGKARAILHPCVERMVAKAGIEFRDPEIISSDPNNVVIIVYGEMKDGDRVLRVWSFGEASPKNNKNAYVYSMAEKRAKGRVALKLLGLHGHLYDETETFVEEDKPKSSRQAKADGDWPAIEADINSFLSTEALLNWAAEKSDFPGLRLAWRDAARELWGKALADRLAEECLNPIETKQWGFSYRRQLEALAPEWLSTARHVCSEHLRALRGKEEVMADA